MRNDKFTIFATPLINTFFRCLSIIFFKVTRWSIIGSPPPDKKFILVAAPHTTNWDFMYLLAVSFYFKFKTFWLGKSSIFRWPFNGFMRWTGGIPVDRSKHSNVVESVIESFKDYNELVLVISPEGSRKKKGKWRTGFYYIAMGLKVPILLGCIDHKNKCLIIGKKLIPTGDIDSDLKEILEFYKEFI